MGEATMTAVKAPETKKENQVSQVQKGNFYQPVSSPVEQIFFLQRTIGNQAVQRLMKSGALQTKLRIGAPGDVYEQEADRVAEQVMRMPEPQAVSSGTPYIQRACPKCEEKLKRQPIKEEDEEEKLQRQSTEKEEEDLEFHIQSLKGGGQALSENNRTFYEPRFGYDFSQVRLHTNTRAPEGKKLLAHELTHVVQQGKGISGQAVNTMLQRAGGYCSPAPLMINRAWNDCGTEADCPQRAAGERTRAHAASLQVGVLTSPENGEIVSHFDIGSSNVSTLDSSQGWAPFWGSLVTLNDRWEILGFSDCEGGIERNTELRWMRAMAVNNALPTYARAKIDRFRAAPLTDCVGENDTEEHRALNRSVVFKRTVTDYTFPEEPITGVTCPPRSRAAVTSLADYVALLMCAETKTSYNPRNMLAMLRQIYYGKTWSSVSQTNKWDNVIPCSPNLGNPEARLGSNLYHALRNSSEIAGVDVGHVFTGLEAMTCPSANVPFFGGLAAVNMPNEEFATWGGDLGAAAAAHVACPQLGAGASIHEDCGGRTGTQPLAFYFGIHAPSQDLEGDIDPFVMRANLMGIPCTGSARRTFSPVSPISEIFQDYYNDPSSGLGTAHANRYSCFLQVLGAIVSGRTITNRSLISVAISNRVFNFADAFYTKIRGMPIQSDIADRMHMRINSNRVTDWFLTYLENRL